jgi:hypothetical protein
MHGCGARNVKRCVCHTSLESFSQNVRQPQKSSAEPCGTSDAPQTDEDELTSWKNRVGKYVLAWGSDDGPLAVWHMSEERRYLGRLTRQWRSISFGKMDPALSSAGE